MEKKQAIIIGLIILVVAIFLFNSNSQKTGFADWYNSLFVKQSLPAVYIEETSDFDYSDKMVQQAAKEIRDKSYSKSDIIKNTIKFTYSSVSYDGGITSLECFSETASKVLNKGLGDCVSMSRLNVALLRANNISSRTIGGCLSYQTSCDYIFAVAPGIEIPLPLITDDNKKRGYLHEWVEAFDGNKWVSIESTTGQIFDSSCQRYSAFGYDSNQYDRCIISDYTFTNNCKVA